MSFIDDHTLKLAIGAVALIITGTIALVLIAAGSYFYLDSQSSGYQYDFRVEANGSVDNVDLKIPTSNRGGNPFFWEYRYESTTLDDYLWEVENVPTTRGQMLKISNPDAKPVEWYDKYGNLTKEVSLDIEADHWKMEKIDTEDPFGSEPMLKPRQNMAKVKCSGEIAENCYEYDTYMHLEWNTKNSTVATLEADNRGYNRYWLMGWKEKFYHEEIEVTRMGNQSGWQRVEVTVRTGVKE